MTMKQNMVILKPTQDGLLEDILDLKLFMRGTLNSLSSLVNAFKKNIYFSFRYIVKIPDGYPLEAAGPVFCAGITMYSPLQYWNVILRFFTQI